MMGIGDKHVFMSLFVWNYIHEFTQAQKQMALNVTRPLQLWKPFENDFVKLNFDGVDAFSCRGNNVS